MVLEKKPIVFSKNFHLKTFKKKIYVVFINNCRKHNLTFWQAFKIWRLLNKTFKNFHFFWFWVSLIFTDNVKLVDKKTASNIYLFFILTNYKYLKYISLNDLKNANFQNSFKLLENYVLSIFYLKNTKQNIDYLFTTKTLDLFQKIFFNLEDELKNIIKAINKLFFLYFQYEVLSNFSKLTVENEKLYFSEINNSIEIISEYFYEKYPLEYNIFIKQMYRFLLLKKA